ncbi:serine/threonine-protein kinase [Planoprotostelium fungivorum]|uniref:Serine/threonine-protein kinase n=1 Tax=Planoprotostelium fungivorum TaxID=1890364 RepID=A0A2P6NJC0_9EUKA|nr:serine/threonine-protein kinase [Planoprotostelium fungivorum]
MRRGSVCVSISYTKSTNESATQIYTGWIYRKEGILRRWKKYWFTLKQTELSFYRNRQSEEKCQKRYFNLQDYEVLPITNDGEHYFPFQMKSSYAVYVFSCKSPQERSEFIRRFNAMAMEGSVVAIKQRQTCLFVQTENVELQVQRLPADGNRLQGRWRDKIVHLQPIESIIPLPDIINRVEQFAALSHHSISTVYGLRRDSNSNFLVTENIKWAGLDSVIRERDSSFHFFDVIIPLAHAISHLHKNDMAHTYLDPSCIYWHPKSSSIKLGGIQHVVGATSLRSRRYTAPELGDNSIEDVETVDLRMADIFSFAMIAYEIMTLTRAFDGLNDRQAGEAIKRGDRPILPDDAEEVVAHIIKECWREEVDLRPDMTRISLQLPIMRKTLSLRALLDVGDL